MNDLLGRGGRLRKGPVDTSPAAGRLQALDEAHALDVREEERLAQDRRHVEQDLRRRIVAGRRKHLAQLLLRQVLDLPVAHRQGGIAFDQGETGE